MLILVNRSVISSLQFHPRENILLTCGLDRKAKLFSITAKKSTKIQSIFLPDLPIYRGRFIDNGNQIVFSGNRKHLYFIDLQSQKIERIPSISNLEYANNLANLFPGNSDYFAIAPGSSKGDTGRASGLMAVMH